MRSLLTETKYYEGTGKKSCLDSHTPLCLCVCVCLCGPAAGEEVLLIQEKLDGIKSRYSEMTASSSKALRTLEQALQLATRFASAHEDLNQWLDSVEAELGNVEPDATPAYQERQKVGAEKVSVVVGPQAEHLFI